MLTASGADTYVWSNGSPTASISVDVMGAGIYWVAGTSACGTDTAYVTVTAMTNTLSYTDVSCAGAGDGSLSIEGSGGSEPYTYLWSTGSTGPQITGLTPGPYSVTITDAEGCAQDASYEITEPPLLTATVGADTTICPGGQAILTAQGAGGTPAYVYTWSPEGPLVSPTETTTYTVVVSDAHGCEAAPLQMTVIIPAGQEVLFSSTGLDGCVPHCITFTASSPAMNSYAWDLGDGTTSNDTVVEHCYDTTGVYTVNVVVVQASGCPDITSAFGPFTIGTAPIANFSWSPEAPTIADPTVAFSDLSTDATSWSWQFDDPAGSSSTDPSPAFVFPGASCYTVSLEVMNDLGCTDSTASEICIQGPDVLVIPNVFSPNDDGNNDLFRISGGDLRQLEVHVFNRWGQQVATLERVRQSWDGRSPAGDVLSAGTYFYTLHAVSNGGDAYDRQGTVTLVR
jgi:gliding motility-associated-like protein